MKYIKMWLYADGTGKYTEEQLFSNENLATRLEVNFQSAAVDGYEKYVDFLLSDGQKMTLPLLAEKTTEDILVIDMDDSLTIEGPTMIQPWAATFINGETVKVYWEEARVVLHYSINNTGEVAFENPDLVAQLFTTKISSNGMNSNIDKLIFNAATADVSPLLEGELRWNAAERTLDIGVDGDGVVLQVGEESYYPRVKNIDTVDIPEGSLVEYIGSLGASGVLLIKRASTSLPLAGSAMGIATETIPKNQTGKVTWFGLIRNIQTNGANYGEIWSDGDILYNSGNHIGGLSKVKPVAPKNALFVAIVVRAHATSGILFVRPLYFPRLEQLSNVFAAAPADQDILYYNSTAGRWENGRMTAGMITYGDGTVEEKLNSLSAADATIDTRLDTLENYDLPIKTYTWVNKVVQPTAIDYGTSTFTAVAHGMSNGTNIYPVFRNESIGDYPLKYLPVGIQTTKAYPGYYVVNRTDNTFQISNTNGGAPIVLTAGAATDISKWHFETGVGGDTVIITGIPSGHKKLKLILKGRSRRPDAAGHWGINGRTSTHTQWNNSIAGTYVNASTAYSYSGGTASGNVLMNYEVVLDNTDLFTVYIKGFRIGTNNLSGNLNTNLQSYYIDMRGLGIGEDITNIRLENIGLANGFKIEVYAYK